MKVHLIHWKEAEARPRVEQLEKLGHEVVFVPFDNSGTMKHVRASAPQALLIDLTRSPSHGKAVAIEARRDKRLRMIPIVFLDGEPEKVAPLRELLPDACFADWKKIGAALKKVKPPAEPVVPMAESSFERYKQRPLHLKLGLKPGMKVVLVNAPSGFDRAAGDFPADIEWQERVGRDSKMIFLFADSQAELDAGLAALMRTPHGLPLWIFWPKQASGVATDLTQYRARTAAHEFGYADYKVCSFDATWSGFLFGAKRKT